MAMNFKTFDVNTVHLTGSNLVEASAGTGKTYSIAILSLRLILENKVPLKEILMVTFTKAAVAELEIRIRKFVREAYKYSLGDTSIENKDIKDLVDKIGKEESNTLLAQVLQELGETSILTIHSFCQNILSEFAFETNQAYSINLLEDLSEVLSDEVRDFWRQEINKFDKNDLKILLEKTYSQYSNGIMENIPYISINVFSKAIKEHLANKIFTLGNQVASHNVFNKLKVIEEEIISFVQLNKSELDNKLNNTKGTGISSNKKEEFLELLEKDLFLFAKEVNGITAKYIDKIFPEEKEYLKEYFNRIDELKKDIVSSLIEKSINDSSQNIVKHLQSKNHLSYDDLIQNLHNAVFSNNKERLIGFLKSKYKAVFVDEFQDTDKLQYEIFNTVFNNVNSILFYIGDPKQSIYGWRKADINTYFEARNAVKNTYSMNTNFRSSKRLVYGLNEIFNENNFNDDEIGFGLFYNEKGSPQNKIITYHEVDAAIQAEETKCILNENEVSPITIFNENKNKNNIKSDVINLVQNLLNNGNLKESTQNISEIKPSDIAILVRSGYDGKEN